MGLAVYYSVERNKNNWKFNRCLIYKILLLKVIKFVQLQAYNIIYFFDTY